MGGPRHFLRVLESPRVGRQSSQQPRGAATRTGQFAARDRDLELQRGVAHVEDLLLHVRQCLLGVGGRELRRGRRGSGRGPRR